MERAKLTVKNFGPLKDIKIEVRPMVTFIGEQASGKSTLAKLLSIFEDENFRRYDEIVFEDELKKYNILSYLSPETEINYERKFLGFIYNFTYKDSKSNKFDYRQNLKKNFILLTKDHTENKVSDEDWLKAFRQILFTDRTLFFNDRDKDFVLLRRKLIDYLGKENTSLPFKDLFDHYEELLLSFEVFLNVDSLYIPSERNFLHIISDNILGLMNNNIQIPKHLLNIGQEYEKALHKIKELPINIINRKAKYKREGKNSYIYHNSKERVNLLESASGYQTLIPIILLVEYSNSLKNNYNFNYVVEEPEINLYPKAQHELIKYLIKNCLSERKNLILTTHSPFVLASINNLLLAYNRGQKSTEEVKDLITPQSWLNPSHFIAYQLKNGKAYKITDDKIGQIKENMIDNVSDFFSEEFDRLLEI